MIARLLRSRDNRVVHIFKWLISRLILVVSGTFLALGLLEILARLYLQPYPYVPFWREDPVLGTAFIAGQQGYYLLGGHNTPVTTNSLGLRDDEIGYSKPDDVYRILLLGDSFGAALEVPLEQSFQAVLEQQLNQATCGQRFEVVNGSVPGWGTHNELWFFESEGTQYQPDLVLLAFFVGNDVSDNGRPPLVVTVDESVPAEPASGPAFNWRKWVDGKLRSFKIWLTRHLHLYVYVNRTLKHQVPPGFVRFLGGVGPWLSVNRDGIPPEYFVYATPVTSAWEQNWIATDMAVHDLAEAVAAFGAEFAIVVLPSMEQAHPHRWAEVLEAYPRMQTLTWDLDLPERRLGDLFSRWGIVSLSLLEPFRTAGRSEDLYYHYDPHFNQAGHKLAATLIYEWLRETELIEGICPDPEEG